MLTFWTLHRIAKSQFPTLGNWSFLQNLAEHSKLSFSWKLQQSVSYARCKLLLCNSIQGQFLHDKTKYLSKEFWNLYSIQEDLFFMLVSKISLGHFSRKSLNTGNIDCWLENGLDQKSATSCPAHPLLYCPPTVILCTFLNSFFLFSSSSLYKIV